MNGGQTSDEELAKLAAGGDERAFSDLYNRYFPEVYDYAIRISRDRDIAALVLQSAFLRLYQALQSGDLPQSIKLYLFAGAQHDLAERMRGRRIPVMEGEAAFVLPDPERIARVVPASELHELTRLAWQAVREFRAEEYELLDLSIRRGLSDDELASFLRSRAQSVQVRIDRARSALEESFTSLLLLNYGRRACLDLDFLVAEDKWSTSLRRRILQHVGTCAVCQGTRRGYMTALEAFAAIGVAPAPPGWQAIMLGRLLKAREGGEATPAGPLLPGAAAAAAAAVAVTPVPAPGVSAATPANASPYTARPLPSYSTNPGFGDRFADWGSGRGPLIAVFGGGMLIVLMIFGALCSAGALDGGDSPSATGTPTVTSTRTTTRTPTVTLTLTATQTVPPVATNTPEPTDVPTSVPPTNTPVPAPPTNTPVPPRPTNTPPPVPSPVTTP